MTRVTNQSLKVAKKKRRKREKIVKKRKIKAMATKCQKVREGISLSIKKKKNYKSDNKDETNPD